MKNNALFNGSNQNLGRCIEHFGEGLVSLQAPWGLCQAILLISIERTEQRFRTIWTRHDGAPFWKRCFDPATPLKTCGAGPNSVWAPSDLHMQTIILDPVRYGRKKIPV